MLGAYVVAIYAFLPYGPVLGKAVAGTPVGAWLIGRGLLVLVGVGATALLVVLRRHRAPVWAYGVLALAALGYALALSWLSAQRLERTHLPEYGIAALLAWRALVPLASSTVGAYAGAACLGAAIGWVDELLQKLVPGRVYDPRDIALNALGAILGIVVLAVVRASPPDGEPEDHQ